MHGETLTVAAADGVSCARVRREINFLFTFETAPFVCVYPVYLQSSHFLPQYCLIKHKENLFKAVTTLKVKTI